MTVIHIQIGMFNFFLYRNVLFMNSNMMHRMVWCLFIQHQRTSYIAHITHDAEREMHEV